MHTRIAVLTMLEPVRVNSQDEYDELCRALGRQLLYGVENPDVTTVVAMNPNRALDEVVCVYSRTLPDDGARDAISEAFEAAGNQIVIGAVKGSDGKFSFHS